MNIYKSLVLISTAIITLSCSKSVVSQNSEEHGSSTNSDSVNRYPGQVLDLTNWKLTLPVNTAHNGNPDEIKQTELNTYQSEWLSLNKAGTAVVFKASAGGETTSGSNFARSELREMINKGTASASWSSGTGKHTLFIDQKVTHLPDVRKHIVIGQIHDADKYVIFFRLEDKKLLISVNKGDRIVLDANYALGTRFNVMFEVEDNQTKCFYNGDLKYTFKGTFEGAYFKAGAYIQSSCKGNKKVAGESCSAYGEVEIYNVWAKHE